VSRGIAPARLRPLALAGELCRLVGERNPGRVRAGVEHLLAERRFALAVLADRGVLAERLDEPPDLWAEVLFELIGSDVGVLEHVVQQAGQHECVGLTVVAQQPADGDRMLDRSAGPAQAFLVRVGDERERVVRVNRPRHREPG
jgi:hypothetical protein